jgi:peptide/nickel transport system permease protein
MVSNVQTAGTILGTRETPGWKKAAIFLWENKTLTIGLVMLIVVVVCTVAAPLITTYGPNDQDIRNRLKPGFWSEEGSPGHPLGTDGVGRDLWSRIVYSFRASLFIAICAVLITVAIGMTVALVSGTFGGWVDALLMRITEVQMAFPFIVLALAILSAVRPTPLVLVVVLSLSAWPFYARVIRSLIITEVQSDYVKAARVQGASTWRILFQYVARNVAPPVFVVATIDIATMIVLEGVLSFLGIGVQPPTPSFGNVIADGKDYLNTAWWVSTFPGVAIVFIVFAFNLVGDTLHKHIDPTLRTRY